MDSVRESVEEFSEQSADGLPDAEYAATLRRIDAHIGPLPDIAEFKPYLDSFSDVWDTYHRRHARAQRHRKAEAQNGGEPADSWADHREVPQEYFSPDFALERHHIFRQSLEASVNLEEGWNAELEGHLDRIEVSLFEHIRTAQRERRFDTLVELTEPLQEDLQGALSLIASFRGQLQVVKKHQLRNGLAVGRLQRRKELLHEVLTKLDCLTHVRQSQPSIQMLLQGQDYVTALDLLESTLAALQSNLKGLTAAKAVSAKLTRLAASFDRAIEADFVHHSVEAVLALQADGEELREAERMQRLCRCLSRRSLLRTAISPTLRDVLLSQLKKAMKAQALALLEGSAPSTRISAEDAEEEEPAVPSSSQSTSASAGISTGIFSLSPDGFLTFWKELLKNCVGIGRRFCSFAAEVHRAVKDFNAGSEGVGEVKSELLRLLEVILTAVLKIAGALLSARFAEPSRAVKVADWQRVLDCSQASMTDMASLIDHCQQLLGLPASQTGFADIRAGFHAILHTQTKTVIEEFHQQKTMQMQSVLESERWERADVPPQYKAILNQVLDREDKDQKQWEVKRCGAGSTLAAEADSESIVKEELLAERYLQLEGVNFIVVPAVLTLLQFMAEYLQLCRAFRELALEVLQRLGALLRLFNTSSHRLVLGGQAVKLAVVSKIQAKNLALCSMCCGLVLALVTRVQGQLTELATGGLTGAVATARGAMVSSLSADFSKIAAEYGEHRGALYGKLSDLLRERYEFHAKRWLSTPHGEPKVDPAIWQDVASAAAAVKRGTMELSPHDALEGLVKDVNSMYIVLLKNLSGDSVRLIFAKAFDEIAVKFEQRLSQEVATPSPPYEDQLGVSLGDRLLLDLAFMQQELEKLTAIATPLQRLLFDLMQHLKAKLPATDSARALHPGMLPVLQLKQ